MPVLIGFVVESGVRNVTWEALQHIESMTIDYDRDELVLKTIDGREILRRGGTRPSSRPEGPFDFKRVTFRPGDLVATMVTQWDAELAAEVFDHDDQHARRAGRPVVYLDQNKWIQISMALHRPERVHTPELGPTRRLIDLAHGNEVILPISSGHWIETGPIYGERRTRLAAEMVGLSRGWLMRDPLLVRASELSTLFGSQRQASIAPSADEVFTLDPRQLHAGLSTRYEERHPNLPAQVVELVHTLSGASAAFAVLLENERTHSPEGIAAATRWATLHQRFAEHLARESATRPHVRALTLHRFLADLGRDLPQAAHDAGLTPGDFAAWLRSQADADIAQLPYLGRERDVIHLRLLNAQDRWERNDLIDMLFLPCAGGYADYVVCENQTADYLRRVARGRPAAAAVCASINELVRALGA